MIHSNLPHDRKIASPSRPSYCGEGFIIYLGKTVYGHLKVSLANDGLVSISKCEEWETL